MPVHNEGASIAATLREWHHELSGRARAQFVICEDGSTDDTLAALSRLCDELPIIVVTSAGRKGYSRAVIDGLNATSAPYVLAVDGDGQCSPADFWKFWERREQHDVIIGWRQQRADSLLRRAISAAFKLYYRRLFPVVVRDPSCPYLLIRRRVIEALGPRLGVLPQGLWWEFIARASREPFSIVDLPVASRGRHSGRTRIYQIDKLPGIAVSHLAGLLRVWRQTR
jgi:glycosyltransferase involved in cell wall biosynthesis